ncbi:MAG: glycosyltransferase family 39 protein [Clostridia bacterium]|nr:glycosyltransferase family 39 protein [Clostridia bacterium]
MKNLKKLFWVFNILLITLLILSRNLNNIDEILNYNFGRYLAKGYILYKDINCIIFPTFPLIMGTMLKMFGEELLIYRFLQILILVLIEILMIKILKKLKLENCFLPYIIITIYMVCISVFSLAEYNMLNCLLLLCILILELKEERKNNFLIGLVIGLAITVKHSVGGCILIAALILEFFQENSLKEKMKNIFLKILGTIITCAVILSYFLVTYTFF